jgi:hypothetical protein
MSIFDDRLLERDKKIAKREFDKQARVYRKTGDEGAYQFCLGFCTALLPYPNHRFQFEKEMLALMRLREKRTAEKNGGE